MKTYVVKAFTGDGRETLKDQHHLIALDIDTPAGFRASSVELTELRAALMEQAGVRERDRSTFRLQVRDRETGDRVMDWVR